MASSWFGFGGWLSSHIDSSKLLFGLKGDNHKSNNSLYKYC